MSRIHVTSLALLTAVMAVGPVGCKKQDTDSPDVAGGFREKNKYKGDIVTGSYRDDHADQGKGIHPNTLRSIEDTIHNSYAKDFERCLEDEMAVADTRFMRSVFSVEFKIDTSGKSGSAKVINIWLKTQNAKGTDIGEVPADNLSKCIVGAIAEWVFDPPPEVDHVHTYKGQIGEAF